MMESLYELAMEHLSQKHQIYLEALQSELTEIDACEVQMGKFCSPHPKRNSYERYTITS
jgi:hypothetical protein